MTMTLVEMPDSARALIKAVPEQDSHTVHALMEHCPCGEKGRLTAPRVRAEIRKHLS